ncbi:odorant receptor 83a-like [Culicoides brevitarsis]|uniref:odorant receptor 83a-like n=1 Tax=Culicoides brevitarsis TaxID=469753 RepID=UPI00307B820B
MVKWKKSFNVKEFFGTPTFWMITTGAWAFNFKKYLPNFLHFSAPTLENLFRIFVAAVLIHIEFVLAVTAYQVNEKEGAFAAFMFIFNILIYLWVCIVNTFYATQIENIKSFFPFVNKGFRQRSAPGLTYVTVEPGFKSSVRFQNKWTWACTLTGSSYALIPLMNGSFQLPIPTWYPIDLTVGHRFLVVFLIQTFAQMWLGMIFGNAMGYVFYVYSLFISQLDILCASVKNIPYTALIKAGIDKRLLKKLQEEYKNTPQELNQFSDSNDIELFEDLDDLELKTDPLKTFKDFQLTPDLFKDPKVVKCLKEAIQDCVDHHTMLLDLLKKYEKQISFFMLLKLGDINLLLTIILFAFTISKDSAARLVLGAYLTIPFSELLILSYVGQVLTLQSSRIIDAVINSPWHLYMVPVKKELSIMLARGAKPYVLTAGRLLNISTGTFIAVVRTSFSYYTLLVQLNKRS